ncbi:MAG: HisS family protein [Chloroflexota bacterium]|nr:HisS family protein [Chloroflexota bacterium]
MAQRCKGCNDLLPGDMHSFRNIEDVFKSCCMQWGYEEIRTPTLEYLHLFTSTGTLTPSMLNKVYSFLDWDGWSGERVVLRPECTIPAARLYVESLADRPEARLFYVQSVFSFEQTGLHSRERWQCGAEYIGSDRPAVDVELAMLALKVLKDVGIGDIEIRLSHAGLLRSLLQKSGLSPIEQDETLDQILDGDMDRLGQVIGGNPQLNEVVPLLFELKGQSSGFLKNLKSSLVPALPEIEPNLDDFIKIATLLDATGTKYQIDIASGKGFEYYTGAIFQFYHQGHKVGAGGRYNDLVPLLGGGTVPASGVALYVDEILKCMPRYSDDNQSNRILLKSNGEQDWQLCTEVANSLRESGFVVALSYGDREPTGFRWTLSIQTHEEASVFVLRDLLRGRKSRVPSIQELLKTLRGASTVKTSTT